MSEPPVPRLRNGRKKNHGCCIAKAVGGWAVWTGLEGPLVSAGSGHTLSCAWRTKALDMVM